VLLPLGHEGQGAARLDSERHVGEDGTTREVGEADPLDVDPPLDGGDRGRAGRVLPVGGRVEQREHALGAGEGGEALVVLIADVGDRREQAVR
jgi:hypothetical protein